MVTFMTSKLPDDWQISDKQNHIFQKSKSYEISKTDMYVGETCNLLLLYFPGVSYYTMKSILNVKDNINLIKVISSCKICAGIKSQQEKKNLFVIQYPNVFVFLKIPLFHFIKSLSVVQFPACF